MDNPTSYEEIYVAQQKQYEHVLRRAHTLTLVFLPITIVITAIDGVCALGTWAKEKLHG